MTRLVTSLGRNLRHPNAWTDQPTLNKTFLLEAGEGVKKNAAPQHKGGCSRWGPVAVVIDRSAAPPAWRRGELGLFPVVKRFGVSGIVFAPLDVGL